MVAISVEYRIRNKHGTSPIQAMEDAKSAIRFIRSNTKLLSIDPNKIAAAGDQQEDTWQQLQEILTYLIIVMKT